MPSGPGERYDFFLSRRGSVAPIAREVTDVLKEQGYNVFVQDYDIRFGNSLVEKCTLGLRTRATSSSYLLAITNSRLTRAKSSRASRLNGCGARNSDTL